MPLCFPHSTQGGPANPEKKDSTFKVWWQVGPGYDAHPHIQLQCHKITALDNWASRVLFDAVQPFMVEARKSNFDPYAHAPYRIVCRQTPYFFALAYAQTYQEIQRDWQEIVQMTNLLLSLNPEPTSSEWFHFYVNNYLSKLEEESLVMLKSKIQEFYGMHSDRLLVQTRKALFDANLEQSDLVAPVFKVAINSCIETFFHRISTSEGHIISYIKTMDDPEVLHRFLTAAQERLEELKPPTYDPPAYEFADVTMGQPSSEQVPPAATPGPARGNRATQRPRRVSFSEDPVAVLMSSISQALEGLSR